MEERTSFSRAEAIQHHMKGSDKKKGKEEEDVSSSHLEDGNHVVRRLRIRASP